MSSNQSQRPIFFEDQYLGADDLNAEIDYCRTQEARHALGAHTWGITAGLQLTEKDSPSGGGQVDAYIQPGYAWDGFGRPIVVLAPYKIPTELFKSILYDAVIDGGTPDGRLIEVWLRYDESAVSAPPAGFGGCNTNGQFSRIQETFRIEVGERLNHSDRHNPVSVAGLSVDAKDVLQRLNPQTTPIVLYDESIPYQDFPEDNPKARWLIPLGSIRWKPNPDPSLSGNFVKREQADLDKSFSQRLYIGVIAGAVYAADRVIRMRDRTKDYSKQVMSSDLVWVEGDLRTEGDVHLFNGKVDFRDANGQDKGISLYVQRQDIPGPKGVLQAVIGKDSQGDNAFSVGPLDSSTPPQFQAKFTVRDDGRVGIGTTAPDRLLTLFGSAGTYLNVKADNGVHEVLLGADNQGGILSTMTNHDLQLRSGGNITRMVIKADGKISMGTPTPAGQLTIKGNLQPQQGELTFFSPTADMEYDGGNDGLFVIKDTGGKTAFIGGNIGIGNTNPGFKLDVADRMRIRQGASGSAGTWLFQTGSNADRAFVGMASDSLVGLYGNAGSGWGLVMDVTNGRVGIGTTNPALTLDIQGEGKFGRDFGSSEIHLWGSRIGDIGGGVLFLRSGGNVVAFDDSGDKVGVGLATPVCKLHVVDNINGFAGNVNAHVAVIENTNTGNDADVLALKVGISNPGSSNNFITFFGGNTAVGSIEGNGAGSISFNSLGADFAECLPRLCEDEAIEEGDVVGIFAGKISKTTAGAHHVVAITGRPIVVGNLPVKENKHLFGQVALLGQVGVKVRGPVQSGDFIIPSGLNDGVGQAISPALIHSVDYMQIIGQAWESSNEQAEKIINVAVGLSSNNANIALATQVNAQQREIETMRAELKNLMALITGGNAGVDKS